MKKTITYKELQKFDNTATNYLIREGYFIPPTKTEAGKFSDKEGTKLVGNIKNVIKQWQKHLETYADELDNIQRNHAAVDEKTKVLLPKNPDGSRPYTIDGEIALKKAIKELADSEIEIHVRITEGELNLTAEEKEAFNGIVIPAFVVEDLE